MPGTGEFEELLLKILETNFQSLSEEWRQATWFSSRDWSPVSKHWYEAPQPPLKPPGPDHTQFRKVIIQEDSGAHLMGKGHVIG